MSISASTSVSGTPAIMCDKFMMSGDVMLKLDTSDTDSTDFDSQSQTDNVVNANQDVFEQSKQLTQVSQNGHHSPNSQDIHTEVNSSNVHEQSNNSENSQMTNTQVKDFSDGQALEREPHTLASSTAAIIPNSNMAKVDEPSAQRLAKRLFTLDGFKRSDVAYHLTRE